MNNTSITKFRWSQKTDSILYKLGIFTIADFEGVSLKALKEMGIPEKTIKQIEDICKVHNITLKDYNLKVYRVKAEHNTYHYNDKFIDFVAHTSEQAVLMMIEYLSKHNMINDYNHIHTVDKIDIYYGANITDMEDVINND